jgi:hypothetical protein
MQPCFYSQIRTHNYLFAQVFKNNARLSRKDQTRRPDNDTIKVLVLIIKSIRSLKVTDKYGHMGSTIKKERLSKEKIS